MGLLLHLLVVVSIVCTVCRGVSFIEVDIISMDASSTVNGIDTAVFLAEESVFNKRADLQTTTEDDNVVDMTVSIVLTHGCNNGSITITIVGNTTIEGTFYANSNISQRYTTTSKVFPHYNIYFSWSCIELNSLTSLSAVVPDETSCHNIGILHVHIASIKFTVDEVNWVLLGSAGLGFASAIAFVVCVARCRKRRGYANAAISTKQ